MAKVIIDTNVFISVINDELDSDASRSLFDRVDAGEVGAIVSSITLAELAAGYFQADDERGWMRTLQHMLSSENFSIIDLDYRVVDQAGRIRADTGLSLPDSIIVASGMAGHADYVVSNDRGLDKALKYLQVVSPINMIQ